MKNGCCWAAVEPRYCSTPSFAPSPTESMKRPSLSTKPPPASGTVWLAPASGGFQRRKPYFSRSAGTACSGRRRFRAVPLALVDDVVAGGFHHRGEVREVGRQIDLRFVFGVGHVFLERVLDPVLGREVTAHQSRARRRAHAGVGEGAFEAEPVPPQAPHPRQVLAQPVRREVLDRAFLVGEEEDDVHPGDVAPLPFRRAERPLDARTLGQQSRRGGTRPRPDQLLAGEAVAALVRLAHLLLRKMSTALLPNAVE